MPSKSLLIAIAAFAVTTTGAHAYVGTKYIDDSGLSAVQRDAFSEARKLRKSGEVDKARDVLLQAGVTDETIDSLRKASHNSHAAMNDAIEAGDFEAFREAIEGTPLYDIVTTEADFTLFKQAHELKMNGKKDESQAIFESLGLPVKDNSKHHERKSRHENFLELTEEQRDALQVARQANDDSTVTAILIEAGISEDKVERMLDKHGWR